MVDTLALGASGGNPVEVQVLSSAPLKARQFVGLLFLTRFLLDFSNHKSIFKSSPLIILTFYGNLSVQLLSL